MLQKCDHWNVHCRKLFEIRKEYFQELCRMYHLINCWVWVGIVGAPRIECKWDMKVPMTALPQPVIRRFDPEAGSSKSLQINPKFRSGGILGKFVFRSGQKIMLIMFYISKWSGDSNSWSGTRFHWSREKNIGRPDDWGRTSMMTDTGHGFEPTPSSPSAFNVELKICLDFS